MENIWKNPQKEKPQDGEIILIREYYKSPKNGKYTNEYRVVKYFEKLGFEMFENLYHYVSNYKITHWMSIPDIPKKL